MNQNKVLKEKLVLKKSIKRLINQTLYTIILLLVGLIIIKKNPQFKETIKKNIYEKNIQFIEIKKIYDKYLGSVLPTINKEEPVFSEKLTFKEKKKYKDGVKLTVNENYMVPCLYDGIVVFIGEKEDYGNTIIIEQTDGTDAIYSNMKEINVGIYDYIEKGSYLGEVNNNELYLSFQKEGVTIDYSKYL